jgi:phosphoribosylformimino-5-aminoimidazole carboxamide ribotide isomerase
MIVYPAIDLHDGKVVRLKGGDINQQTRFSDDPVAVAKDWIAQGASWIHVVNLDGALNKANDNLDVVAQITALDVQIQFGGGLRTLEQAHQAIQLGVDRLVLGTIAVQNPEIVRQAVTQFGKDVVCVGLDARGGTITTHGWQEASDLLPEQFGQTLFEMGARHALYTDVSRDGGMTGVNIAETARIGKMTGLQVIASGGVHQLSEIGQLAASPYIAGVVIGMALYTGEIKLKDALEAAGGS